MATTEFRTTGEVQVELDTTWTELMDEVIETISDDVGSFNLTSFGCEVTESDGVEVYQWEARGTVID